MKTLPIIALPVVLNFLSATFPNVNCQASCGQIRDCIFYRCVETNMISACPVWKNPFMQAQYFCEKMQQSKSNFSKEVLQFTERFLNCSRDQIVKRNPKTCQKFSRDSIDSFKYCFTKEIEYLDEHFKCSYLEELANVILSPDMLALEYSHSVGKQYWHLLMGIKSGSLEDLSKCSGFNEAIKRAISVQKEIQKKEPGSHELVIIFDSSESIGNDKFEKLKTKISEFILTLQQNISIGIVRYSGIVHTISPVVDASHRQELIEQIDKMTYTGGTTATDAGLLRAKTLFNNYSSYESCVEHQQRHSIIIVTDGLSNNMRLSITTARTLKESVEIYVLAIGDTIHAYQLGEIASTPASLYLRHVKDINDFIAMSSALSSLKNSLDNSPKVIYGLNCKQLYVQLNGTSVYHFKKSPVISFMNLITNSDLVLYGSYSEKIPDPVTADFSSIGMNISQRLKGNEDVFITIVSKQSQMATFQWLLDVGKLYFNLSAESTSTNIIYGARVDLVCSAHSYGMTTFIWLDLSHGIVQVNIVQNSSQTYTSMFSTPVYKTTTFVCVVQQEGTADISRGITIESSLFTTEAVIERASAIPGAIVGISGTSEVKSTCLLPVYIVIYIFTYY